MNRVLYRESMSANSDEQARELALLIAAVVEPAADFSPGRRGERGVRQQVQALCTAARSCGLSIEHLLVRIKDTWWQHGSVLEAPHTDARERLAAIVTLCIDEYYRDDTDGNARARTVTPTSPSYGVNEDPRPRLS